MRSPQALERLRLHDGLMRRHSQVTAGSAFTGWEDFPGVMHQRFRAYPYGPRTVSISARVQEYAGFWVFAEASINDDFRAFSVFKQLFLSHACLQRGLFP